MFSKTMLKPGRSVASRLALAYSALFTASTAAALALVYFMTSAFLAHETDETLLYLHDEIPPKFRRMDIEAFRDDLSVEIAARGTNKIVIRIFSPGDRIIFSSDLTAWKALPSAAEVRAKAGQDKPSLFSRLLPGHEYETRFLCSRLGGGNVLEVGLSTREHAEFLSKLLRIGGITLGAMVILGTAVGWAMARHAMSGVKRVTRAAMRIAGGHFGDRVSASGEGEEIDRLVAAFNEMAERIEVLMRNMKEVNDNIAHDLRSPITRIRCSAETALLGKDIPEDCHAAAAEIVDGCDRLLGIIESMLDIAEYEAGVARLEDSEVDVGALVKQGTELFETVAEEKEIVIATDVTQQVRVRGDVRKLQRMLANLLDNAVKYAPAGERVLVKVVTADKHVEITVSDSGPPIPQDDLRRIFDRFYRGDRSRSQPGSGLGLALSLAIAKAHGGTISASSSREDGNKFTVVLPAAIEGR
jgi:signal transduction histidine kinase